MGVNHSLCWKVLIRICHFYSSSLGTDVWPLRGCPKHLQLLEMEAVCRYKGDQISKAAGGRSLPTVLLCGGPSERRATRCCREEGQDSPSPAASSHFTTGFYTCSSMCITSSTSMQNSNVMGKFRVAFQADLMAPQDANACMRELTKLWRC